jgi:predicted RNase H-like nuclease (RuvC/YqgF family)
MDWTTVIVAVIGAFGAGGLGAALVNWLSNKDVKKADAYATISAIYETRLKALSDRATCLEVRVEKLEGIIQSLRTEVEERDDMIDTLQRENEDLRKQVADLQTENECKERKIQALQTQVKVLTARLDELTKGANG